MPLPVTGHIRDTSRTFEKGKAKKRLLVLTWILYAFTRYWPYYETRRGLLKKGKQKGKDLCKNVQPYLCLSVTGHIMRHDVAGLLKKGSRKIKCYMTVTPRMEVMFAAFYNAYVLFR